MSRTNPRQLENLPSELSSFIGRRWELGEVKRLLGESRLVTLAGGTGTTRLSPRTSREPLPAAGEVLFAVPPLPSPDAGTRLSVAGVDRYEWVALFLARAEPAVSGVVQLGKRCDAATR
jgi:predicted ATPase